MNNQPLTIKNLSKTYLQAHIGKKTATKALRGINLKLENNEIFSLIGLNGSGKTTAIKLILGLIHPDTGKVKIFGNPHFSSSSKRKTGYLPEMPYFNRNFTPIEILKFWGSLSDIPRDKLKTRIQTVLKYTSLKNEEHRKLNSFSRGMLQRLGLAQALLSDPELLILDEPMGGLDPRGIIEIRDHMKKLKEREKTIFFSSHSISEVEKVADRVAVLHKGKILKITKPHSRLEDEFLTIISDYERNNK